MKNIKDTLNGCARQKNDIVLYSIHWGGNWGWDLEIGQRKFAHMLIDEAGVSTEIMINNKLT